MDQEGEQNPIFSRSKAALDVICFWENNPEDFVAQVDAACLSLRNSYYDEVKKSEIQYSSNLIQAAYIKVYYTIYVYLFKNCMERRGIQTRLMQMIETGNSMLNFVSIGCGAAPDVLGFKMMLNEKYRDVRVNYSLFDRTSTWKPTMDLMLGMNMYEITENDFSNKLHNENILIEKCRGANIITFMYLFSEFKASDRENIVNNLKLILSVMGEGCMILVIDTSATFDRIEAWFQEAQHATLIHQVEADSFQLHSKEDKKGLGDYFTVQFTPYLTAQYCLIAYTRDLNVNSAETEELAQSDSV